MDSNNVWIPANDPDKWPKIDQEVLVYYEIKSTFKSLEKHRYRIIAKIVSITEVANGVKYAEWQDNQYSRIEPLYWTPMPDYPTIVQDIFSIQYKGRTGKDRIFQTENYTEMLNKAGFMAKRQTAGTIKKNDKIIGRICLKDENSTKKEWEYVIDDVSKTNSSNEQ